VLGGTQSLHTDSYDEALALPTDNAALIALRTQQIIAEETGVRRTRSIQLGGSWYVESLTEKMIEGCFDYFRQDRRLWRDGRGGRSGFPQREIQESAYLYQKGVERGEQTIVGVNKYAMDDEIHKTDILQIDETVRAHQLERLAHVKATRDNGAVANSLERLKKAAQSNENTMPAIIDAVAAYATVEEICVALRDVYGIYEEPAF
jgi:methylmalonyl-CoA mutase N-terminal domain/subunit